MMRQRIDEQSIQEVGRRIGRQFHPEKVILFGSWAWGKPGPDSDVDLLVVKAVENTRAFAREIDGFLFPRPFPLDVMVYQPAHIEQRRQVGDFFISEILSKGKVLYDKQAA